jgi:hypothetical protein
MVTQLMVCKMMLNESFWRHFELDLQEIKLAYLNWAIGYAREPKPEYRHLFRWEHQDCFCIINSRYGRAFAFSPFGPGVRGVPRPRYKGIPRGLDEIDIALKARLTENTRLIRSAIVNALQTGKLENARQMVLNFYWLKLGAHELLFDRTQLEYNEHGKVRKGRWGLDESENWRTLNGIRNRIINVTRYGEFLEEKYVLNLNRRLPGFSRNTRSTFLSSAFSWNRYGMCAFDCGPVLWSKKGFVHFSQVKKRMNQIGWPYRGCPSQVLRPLYAIALNYRRPPIRRRGGPDEGYSLKSLRRRACQIYEIIDNILNEINRIRNEEIG